MILLKINVPYLAVFDRIIEIFDDSLKMLIYWIVLFVLKQKQPNFFK